MKVLRESLLAGAALLALSVTGAAHAASCASPAPATAVNLSMTDNLPQDSNPLLSPLPMTTIKFTLLLPPRCPGDTFPMVLQQPGYGGNRQTQVAADGTLYPYDAHFDSIDRLTRALPYYGYIVLSFDPRGLGDSIPPNGGGYARIMDPAMETQDARALLDWAYDHAATYGIQTQPSSGIAKDIVVGTLGYSYGGGFQMPLAALDPRIDTIVPNGTWYSLDTSLIPDASVKGSWVSILCLLARDGHVWNTPYMQTLCNIMGPRSVQANQIRTLDQLTNVANGGGDIPPRPEAVSPDELENFVTTHGMNYFQNQQMASQPWGYGESSATLRKVPALFLQGNRDVLFNLTEAYLNSSYFAATGADVRVISTEGGHMDPATDQFEGPANCGTELGVNAILAWYNYWLKGQTSPTFTAIPRVCISVADTLGAPNVKPVGLSLPKFPVGAQSGVGTVPATLASAAVTLANNAVAPQFVPVTKITTDGAYLAGVPTIGSITVTAGSGATLGTNAFVSVGIRRKGQLILVDDQVTAFSVGTHTHNDFINVATRNLLPAVGEPLQSGDQVGLVFQGQTAYYVPFTNPQDLVGLPKYLYEFSGKGTVSNLGSKAPIAGLTYPNPYSATVTDVELPIIIPGQFPGSALLQ